MTICFISYFYKGPSYGSWIYNYLCNQCLSPCTNIVSSNPTGARCIRTCYSIMWYIESNTGKSARQGNLRHPRVRFQSFTDEARRVSERLKSYPRVSEISLSCTFCRCLILFLTFISCYLIVLFTFQIERFPANFVSIAEVNIQFIHMHPCLGSILNVFHNKIQCI